MKLVSTKTADASKPAKPDVAKELTNILGIKFKAIEDVDRRRHNIPAAIRGVIVQSIETGSDALGKIPLGSVVTEVNFQPVSSPEQAIAAAQSAKAANKPVLLQVWGEDEVTYVAVRVR